MDPTWIMHAAASETRRPRAPPGVVRIVALALVAALAGCVADDAATPAGRDAATDEGTTSAPRVVTTDHVIPASLAASTPVTDVEVMVVKFETIRMTARVSAWIVELDWEPASEFSERLAVQARVPAGPTDAPTPPDFHASGAPPLRIVVPGDAFAEGTELDFFAHAAADPAGASAEQPITAYVTSFSGIPFDPEFSAVEP